MAWHRAVTSITDVIYRNPNTTDCQLETEIFARGMIQVSRLSREEIRFHEMTDFSLEYENKL